MGVRVRAPRPRVEGSDAAVQLQPRCSPSFSLIFLLVGPFVLIEVASQHELATNPFNISIAS